MILYYLLKKILFKRISNLRIQFIFQYLLTRMQNIIQTKIQCVGNYLSVKKIRR